MYLNHDLPSYTKGLVIFLQMFKENLTTEESHICKYNIICACTKKHLNTLEPNNQKLYQALFLKIYLI